MYIPPAFREDDASRQYELIRQSPLGLLVSSTGGWPQVSPLPFILDVDETPSRRLLGHLSRGNEHWTTLDGSNVIVVFQGPDAYVSPSWYVTKAEHGKVVPTWNYAMVQVRGIARVRDDEQWLRHHITELTDTHESPRSAPWQVTDAPASFIDGLVKGIIGIEIEIDHIDGKWKVSQNRPTEDRKGVVAGLTEAGDSAMAALVDEHIPK